MWNFVLKVTLNYSDFKSLILNLLNYVCEKSVLALRTCQLYLNLLISSDFSDNHIDEGLFYFSFCSIDDFKRKAWILSGLCWCPVLLNIWSLLWLSLERDWELVRWLSSEGIYQDNLNLITSNSVFYYRWYCIGEWWWFKC